MKKILFFVLALTIVASCGKNKKKKDQDPQPDNKTTTVTDTTKDITVYITRNDFYPNSTNYYSVTNVTLSTVTNGVGNNYFKPGTSGAGPKQFLDVKDSTYYIGFNTTSSGYGSYILPGTHNTKVDSVYIHTVYE